MIEVCLLFIVGALYFAVAKLTLISQKLSAINNQLTVMIELDAADRREREHEENRKWRAALDAAEAERAPPPAYSGYTGPDWAKR